MSGKLAILACVLATALAGCGNVEDPQAGLFRQLSGALGPIFNRAEAPARLRPTGAFPGVDPALVAGTTAPLTGAWLEKAEALATLAIATQSGDMVTWRTGDGATLTLADGGVLVATRGLGADLNASDASATRAAIRAGQSATVSRRYVHLNTAYERRETRVSCTLTAMGPETLTINNRTHRTLRLEEACRGDGLTFTNRYWRDARGPAIWQSTQWISPEAGVIHLQRLVE